MSSSRCRCCWSRPSWPSPCYRNDHGRRQARWEETDLDWAGLDPHRVLATFLFALTFLPLLRVVSPLVLGLLASSVVRKVLSHATERRASRPSPAHLFAEANFVFPMRRQSTTTRPISDSSSLRCCSRVPRRVSPRPVAVGSFVVAHDHRLLDHRSISPVSRRSGQEAEHGRRGPGRCPVHGRVHAGHACHGHRLSGNHPGVVGGIGLGVGVALVVGHGVPTIRGWTWDHGRVPTAHEPLGQSRIQVMKTIEHGAQGTSPGASGSVARLHVAYLVGGAVALVGVAAAVITIDPEEHGAHGRGTYQGPRRDANQVGAARPGFGSRSSPSRSATSSASRRAAPSTSSAWPCRPRP